MTLPDEMGVWAESGAIIWLPRAHYPTRDAARKFCCEMWECGWTEARVRLRSMRADPKQDELSRELEGVLYVECSEDAQGAFPVWRCE